MDYETETYPLLFADMPLEARVMVIDNLFADLSADDVRLLVTEPAILGLLAEAHCGGSGDSLESLEELSELLSEDDFRELVPLVNEALLARLPALA